MADFQANFLNMLVNDHNEAKLLLVINLGIQQSFEHGFRCTFVLKQTYVAPLTNGLNHTHKVTASKA